MRRTSSFWPVWRRCRCLKRCLKGSRRRKHQRRSWPIWRISVEPGSWARMLMKLLQWNGNRPRSRENRRKRQCKMSIKVLPSSLVNTGTRSLLLGENTMYLSKRQMIVSIRPRESLNKAINRSDTKVNWSKGSMLNLKKHKNIIKVGTKRSIRGQA